MEILKKAAAGTMESSDVYVEIEPGTGKREILLDSVVLDQFGESIRRVTEQVLASTCSVTRRMDSPN